MNMSYYLAKIFSYICCLLPARFCDWLGNQLGRLTWLVVPQKRKRMARENIQRCLEVDAAEAERIAKASWVRFGPMLLEVLRFPVLRNHLTEYVEVTGKEYLDEAMASGKGGVLATSHSGYWELMGGALASLGCPLVGVAMKQKEAAMDRFINDYRRMVGIHVTYKTSVTRMFRMLKEGWFIGLLMDQDTSMRDGIILQFFGQETNCVPGPAALARSQDAPILPVYITKLPDGRHRLMLHKPIYVERTRDKQADIRRTSQQLMDVLEQHVRDYPEDWFWLHDRWKSIRHRYD